MNFIVYQDSDGRILRVGECDTADLAAQALTGQTAIAGIADDRIEYVSAGAITARPDITATWDFTTLTADGVDSCNLGSTLPNPTAATVIKVPDGAIVPDPETVTGGTFNFKTTVPGSYTIIIDPAFPYKQVTQDLIAT